MILSQLIARRAELGATMKRLLFQADAAGLNSSEHDRLIAEFDRLAVEKDDVKRQIAAAEQQQARLPAAPRNVALRAFKGSNAADNAYLSGLSALSATLSHLNR